MQKLKPALLICDIQRSFVPHIPKINNVINTTKFMVNSSRIFNIPLIITEQNPSRLKHTCPEILELTKNHPKTTTIHKTKFSMCVEPVLNALRAEKAKDLLLMGIESHVCILQSCLDFISKGFNVYVVMDGIASQRKIDFDVAVQRMKQEGAKLTTAESIVYQILADSNSPYFKEILKAVKDRDLNVD